MKINTAKTLSILTVQSYGFFRTCEILLMRQISYHKYGILIAFPNMAGGFWANIAPFVTADLTQTARRA